MSQSIVGNGRQFLNAVDVWMNQYRKLPVEMFREYVWEVFKQVLRATPQFTGRAVANWNMSIGTPNLDFDPNLGDDVDIIDGALHQRGDERWMRVARDRARPIMRAIRSGDKVYISNGVIGDDGKGDDNFAYMQALQSPGYWSKHLREVHKPYETVEESMVIVNTRFLNKGMSLPRVGGRSWE